MGKQTMGNDESTKGKALYRSVAWAFAVHAALMTSKGKLDDEKIYGYAGDVGIDVNALKGMMKAPAVEAEIEKNMLIARELDITGTPSFIVGKHLVPGAVDMNALKQLVATARKG